MRGGTSAQFAGDGKTVVTAGGDGTARLWDVASGQARQVLRGHEGEVTGAQFAGDGKTVVTAGKDGSARLWDCQICRPLDEVIVKVKKAIGRDLTVDEAIQFGVQDAIVATNK